METRANYVLVGALTLLAILGGLGFFVWLAQFEVNRQYAYYDVIFDNVSGLSRAADVRFNGLSVGQVTGIELSERHPGKVRARIEVNALTPITVDTTAQLSSQGVTGVSYVALTSGRDDSAPLTEHEVEGVPEIIARRSVVESLTEDAPDLIAQAKALVEEVRKMFGPERTEQVDRIFANVESASGKLDTVLADVSSLSASLSEAAGHIGTFTDQLDPLGASLDTTLGNTDRTLEAARGAFTQAGNALGSATAALDSAKTTFDDADAALRRRLPLIVDNLSDTVATLRKAVDELNNGATSVLGKFGGTADAATARLNEMQATLGRLDTALADASRTLVSVESASRSVDTLVSGEGAGLVTDARASLAEIQPGLKALNAALTSDLPALAADVRVALDTANRVITEVGEDVGAFTAGLKPLTDSAGTTLATATGTLRDASATLARIDAALDTADGTLRAAEGTFTSAQRVMDEDVAPTAADIRAAAASFEATAAQVARDLPAVTSELRATIERGSAMIGRIDGVVASSAGPLQGFATNGLPQLTRFLTEARALVSRLDALTARIERDPAGFFLGNRAPDYRR